MIGKVQVTSWSNRVHFATRNMLDCYPHRELKEYAMALGIEVGKTKDETIANLLRSNKATICGSLGN